MTAVDMIELLATNTAFKQVRPSGEDPEGTMLTYAFDVLQNKVKVGGGTGHCIIVSERVAHCFNCLMLGGRGDIVFGGAEDIEIDKAGVWPRPSEVPVLGGTGEFAGAGGTVTMSPVPGTTPLEHRLVFNLLWA